MWLIGRAHRATLLRALEDAAASRVDAYSGCRDCINWRRPCRDHRGDLAAVRAYDALHERLEGRRTRHATREAHR